MFELNSYFLSFLLLTSIAANGQAQQQEVLFDFTSEKQLNSIDARGVKLSVSSEGGQSRLMLESSSEMDWPGITLKPDGDGWNASKFQNASFEVENRGDHSFEIGLRLDNPGADKDESKRFTVMTQVLPGETKSVTAAMNPTPWKFSKPMELVGMHAAPGQPLLDQSNINQIIIFLRQPSHEHKFSISNVQFHEPLKELDAETFLPFIDQYGQFIHDDWPAKTKSDEDLIAKRESEQADLESHPGPEDFNQYGGEKTGTKLAAQKHFRVEKIDGKWWFVDPSGARFWSHGIDSVSTSFASTGVEHRESYFKKLPKEGEPGSEFYFQSTWGFGFYASRTPYRMFNFLASNLSRKYGADWNSKFADLAHRRIRSWGINTLACWSDKEICLQHKTPYTAFLRLEDCPVLEGAEKRWTRFADVYAKEFKATLQHTISANSEAIGDPWCIGFFVDNELYWGEDHSLGLWTLQSPAKQAAKVAMVTQLKGKYSSIEALNAKWKTEYKSWEDLSEQTEFSNIDQAKEDLLAFSKDFVKTYFETIKTELNKSAPGQLYLGCRFIWQNETAVRAACKYCDVVSFNCYRYSPTSIQLPKGEDKPIVIGEFHFGALDRGMFHPSKVPTKDQAERAKCYESFVTDALNHPNIIGTHWFQYVSEATSGRGDGENYQIGFVDICDTPYQETVDAARRIGYQMYEVRSATTKNR